MSELLRSVNARNRLEETSEVEILLFTLGADGDTGRRELFGLNVSRVREVMRTPEITRAPEMQFAVSGMVSLRGELVPVIDLAEFVGSEAPNAEITIVTEINGETLGVLVETVDTILRLDRTALRAPPHLLSKRTAAMVTAVTELEDGRLVMMLDFEQLLAGSATGENPAAVNGLDRWPGSMTSSADTAPADLLDSVYARTRLAASNCMELLLFSLGGRELYGINVFKVREITRTPRITRAPNLPAGVEGVVSLRGSIIPVVALARVIGATAAESSNSTMMVTEFNRRVQALLLDRVERIVRVQWARVRTPDAMLGGQDGFITAITELDDGRLVSVLDVEQVLSTIHGETDVPHLDAITGCDANIFFADDSAVARREIVRVLDRLGIRHQHAGSGREAWDRLQGLAARASADREPLARRLNLILTDAEMPEMDGYVLTRQIKADPRFAGIPVVMHSSLSSEANRAMGTSVGVDAYVSKFDPKVLADTLRPLIQEAARAAATPEVSS